MIHACISHCMHGLCRKNETKKGGDRERTPQRSMLRDILCMASTREGCHYDNQVGKCRFSLFLCMSRVCGGVRGYFGA